MKILALDLSTKSTGYAVYNDNELIDYGCITATSTDFIKRIQKIIKELNIKLQEHKPDKVVAEEVRPEGTGYGVGNLHTHKTLMYLQAAVAFLLHEQYAAVPFEFVYPSSWRATCGIKNGRGIKRSTAKAADVEWAEKTFGIKVNDDIADAIGIGYSQIQNFSWGTSK